MDNTLQSIENLPSENDENEPLLEFRFQARNMSVDWRKLSLIDVDAIAASMDIDQLQARFQVLIVRIQTIIFRLFMSFRPFCLTSFQLLNLTIGSYRVGHICQFGRVG